jgi:thiol-disulfide isomerase/thioredoxin
MVDILRRQVDATREYIEEHPDAADVDTAEQDLAALLSNFGRYAEAAQILVRRYDKANAQETDLQTLFQGFVMPAIQSYVRGGLITEGRAFVEHVRTDLGSRSGSEIALDVLDEIAASLKIPAAGETAEVIFTATDGTEVDVSEMTNRVVLVDFWASWCGPCIQTMPGLKALYEAQHTNGFNIVGISLDKERADFNEAVTKLGITWPQSFDGLLWGTPIAARYGIQSIPTTILIGKDGKVAAVNLLGARLEAKILDLLATE